MEEKKVRENSTKTQLSLAAAMFFSPLVQYLLHTSKRDLSEQEKKFIHGYIKVWYVNITLGIIAIVFGVLNYVFLYKTLHIVYTISIFILLIILLISIVSILSDISLLSTIKSDNDQWYISHGSKRHIILAYLPLYNIYLRYQSHTFEKPNRRIKESLLIWTIFTMASLLWNVRISTMGLILIITRIASLISDIDIVPLYIKHHLNSIFLKNPEEMWWYVTWFLRYLWKYILHLWKPMPTYSLEEEVINEKSAYQQIISVSLSRSLMIEYLLWIVLLIGVSVALWSYSHNWAYYLWIGILIGRYMIMFTTLKHLPHLPVAREILLIVYYIWKRILSFIHHK